MRANGTLRGQADRVAGRVRELLSDPDLDPDLDLAPPAAPLARPRAGSTWWGRVAARVPVRLDPGRRGALAIGIVVVLAALATGAWLLSARPQAVPLSASAPSVPSAGPLVGTDGVTDGASGSAAASSSGASVPSPSTSASVLVVDVAGKVRRPGVYRLPAGSRVDDALRAAGGARGRVDLSTLNLAALLVDGQQVAVGVPAAAGAPVAGSAAAGGASSGVSAIVDVNTATLEQLETLPGVGPVLGQDILDYRNTHGSFTAVEQLQDVSGIGDVKFGELKSLVTV